MYREFDEDEITTIKAYMDTPAYKAALSESNYLRAYRLSKIIEDSESHEPFLLLQSALWYGKTDSSVQALYRKELSAMLPKFSDEDRPFWMAGASFQAWKNKEKERAQQLLKNARASADSKNEYLMGYIQHLDDCYSGQLSSDVCSATSKIPQK